MASRIKKWRNEAALSLQQLANRSGVSPSTIHKIEHNQTIPTIAVVLKLAAGLGRRATELVEDEVYEASAVLTRAGERREVVTARGAHVEDLGGELDKPGTALWRIVQPPGVSFGNDPLGHVDGELIVFVERGRLVMTVGDKLFRLGQGDSLHFEVSTSYDCRNDGDLPARLLLIGNLAQGLDPSLLAQMRRLEGRSRGERDDDILASAARFTPPSSGRRAAGRRSAPPAG